MSAKFYRNVLEEVGNDVIKPLAFGVALPLINLTFQSIGSFAVPFLKNAYEQSEVVLKAVLDNEDNDGNNDILSRTSSALQSKQYEQTIRKLDQNINKGKSSIINLNIQLEETSVKSKKLSSSMVDFTAIETKIKELIDKYERYLITIFLDASLHFYK